jgi:hypothetical protein
MSWTTVLIYPRAQPAVLELRPSAITWIGVASPDSRPAGVAADATRAPTQRRCAAEHCAGGRSTKEAEALLSRALRQGFVARNDIKEFLVD